MSAELKEVPKAAELTGRDLTGEVERIDEADMETLKRVLEKQQQARQIDAAAQQAQVEAQAVTRFFREGVTAKYNLKPNDDITQDGRIVRNPYAEIVPKQ